MYKIYSSYKFILRSNRQRKKNVRKQSVKFDVVNPIYGLYYFSDGQQVDDTKYMLPRFKIKMSKKSWSKSRETRICLGG